MPLAVEPGPEHGITIESLTPALLVGAAILLVCIAAVRLSSRTGLPSLLIYLAVGLAVGEAGLGIDFESQHLTQVLGYAALILILTEGGFTTRWSSMRRSVAPAILLSTLGVVVSVIVVAAFAHTLLHLDWTTSLLIGAILSSTDAAAVFSVLRNVPLPRRLTGVLEAESGFNDAPVVLLVVALSARASAGDGASESLTIVAVLTIVELAGGASLGVVIGWLGGRFMARTAAGSSGLFSIGIVAVPVLAYAAAATVHSSGFIACYLAALVLGNMELPNRTSAQAFVTGLGWLAQIGLFVLLGLLASPSGFRTQLVPATVLGLGLLIVARPLSVLASVSWFGLKWREQAFLSWAGLRGAVPVVLATVPATASVPNVEWIFDLVFVLVVLFTLVQAPLLPRVARRLGVVEKHRARATSVESAPLDELKADLIHVDVGAESQLHGVSVFELRLPEGANVNLIVRDGRAFVPTGRTVLRHGDQLLVVATTGARERTEQLIHEISKGGRLAGWLRGSPPELRRRRPGTPGRGTTGRTPPEAL